MKEHAIVVPTTASGEMIAMMAVVMFGCLFIFITLLFRFSWCFSLAATCVRKASKCTNGGYGSRY